MKNSKEYSKKIQSLYRKLKREYPKVLPVTHDEPAEAIVYATISEDMNDSVAKTISRRFGEYFVDLNDLRVSRPEEIVEVLGANTPANREIAASLNKTLTAIFNAYHTVSLNSLKKIGKRPAKQTLEKLTDNRHFVVNYSMLTALQGHAIPLTRKMVGYLKTNELIDPEADEQEIEGFLTRQISAKNGYEFYALLRQKSDSTRIKKRTKKKTTRKAKTKTTAKVRKRKK